jgi:hypothetical protein
MMRRLDGPGGERDFDELVGGDDLDATEAERLRHVHELLVEAGPPPELPPSLLHPPTESRPGELVHLFPRTARRRVRAYGLLAAAVAAAVFGGGFLLGHSKAKPETFATTRVVPMHGAGEARGSIRVAGPDTVGNWPMLVSVSGLPEQPTKGAYYELWLTRNGKAIVPCGGFRVHGGETTVRFTVPYRLRSFDGWIVTDSEPGQPEPGKIVLST